VVINECDELGNVVSMATKDDCHILIDKDSNNIVLDV